MLELTEKERQAHQAAKRNSAAFCKSEKDIILDVIFAAESKYYRKLGHMTLVLFIEHEMKIDSQLMYDLNIVTRRALIFPYLNKALKERKLNVGKALRIGASLTKENVKEFVDFACSNTIREINKKVAENKDPGKKREYAKQKGDVMEVKIFPTLDEWKMIERARVVQGNARRASGIKATILAAITTHLYKNDPVEKAKRARPGEESFVQTEKRERSQPRRKPPSTNAISAVAPKSIRMAPAAITKDGYTSIISFRQIKEAQITPTISKRSARSTTISSTNWNLVL